MSVSSSRTIKYIESDRKKNHAPETILYIFAVLFA